MSRPIDAEKLINIINPNGLNNPLVPLQDVMRAIAITPTEDVAPVVHGHWYRVENLSLGWKSFCSCCGAFQIELDYNYCPSCGAKMDDEENK